MPAERSLDLQWGPHNVAIKTGSVGCVVRMDFKLFLAADKDMTAKMDAVFKDFQSDDAPGVAVLVIQNGKSIFERGYGVSDLRTKQDLAQRRTSPRIIVEGIHGDGGHAARA